MSGVVVLVEGDSDRNALAALARRRALDLAGRGITVVAMGGITNLHRNLLRFGSAGTGRRLVGLYDVAEDHVVRRALERAGVAAADPEAAGFHRCVPDLEAELIRALGVPAVERIVADRRELRALRTLQAQAYWSARPAADQIRRFLGNGIQRKATYATLMVDALDLDRAPAPLDRVLADAITASALTDRVTDRVTGRVTDDRRAPRTRP